MFAFSVCLSIRQTKDQFPLFVDSPEQMQEYTASGDENQIYKHGIEEGKLGEYFPLSSKTHHCLQCSVSAMSVTAQLYYNTAHEVDQVKTCTVYFTLQ